MLGGFVTLLIFQLLGEALALLLGLPVPGPVIGMVLLFSYLAPREAPAQGLELAAGGLLRHLSLLFVPAGVGVVLYAELLWEAGPALLLIVVAATLLTIALTALALRAVIGGQPPAAGAQPGKAQL